MSASQRLDAAGVAVTVVQHFDDALRHTPYDAFVERIRARVALSGFLMTPDAAFGFERRGTPQALAELGARDGFDVVVVPPFTLEGRPVRSTEVRAAIAGGDLDDGRTPPGTAREPDRARRRGRAPPVRAADGAPARRHVRRRSSAARQPRSTSETAPCALAISSPPHASPSSCASARRESVSSGHGSDRWNSPSSTSAACSPRWTPRRSRGSWRSSSPSTDSRTQAPASCGDSRPIRGTRRRCARPMTPCSSST